MTSLLKNKKIGFIGGGQMAEAIFSGFIKSKLIKKEDIYVSDISENRLICLSKKYKLNIVNNKGNANKDLIEKCDIVFLAVKPQFARQVLSNAAPYFSKNKHIVFSIMGGVTTAFIEEFAQDVPIIRIMPNIPMLVRAGVAGIALGRKASKEHGDMAVELFSSVGLSYILPENMIDPLTSISGCGPAYACIFIEAMADGGVQMGLSREMALILAAQTLIGAGKMILETKEHPGKLKDSVCSPGGATIAGVRALEDGGVRGIIMSAVEAGMIKMTDVGKKV